MNITPHANPSPLATVVNPPTDSLRRDNVQREVISQPAAASQSAAEKGVASEKERVRTPAQNVEEGIDFAALQEQAELENATINERQQEQGNSDPEQLADDSEFSNGDESEDAEVSEREAQPQSLAEANELSPEEQRIVKDLQAREVEVHAHEQAHASVGGQYTGTPSYTYETGPDGKRYAVGGEVSVDVSVPSDPEEAVAKMRRVQQAALAPANPSAQDLRVAAEASRELAQAQLDVMQERSPLSNEDENDLSEPLGGRGPEVSSLDELKSEDSANFDEFINSTLEAQDRITSSRDQEIDDRAVRIATFYSDITQAYERPPRNQFQIQA